MTRTAQADAMVELGDMVLRHAGAVRVSKVSPVPGEPRKDRFWRVTVAVDDTEGRPAAAFTPRFVLFDDAVSFMLAARELED